MINHNCAISLKKYNELIYYKVNKVTKYFYKYYNRYFLKVDITGKNDITLSKTTHIFLFDFSLFETGDNDLWCQALKDNQINTVFIYERHGRVTDIFKDKTAAVVLENLYQVCTDYFVAYNKDFENLDKTIHCIVDFYGDKKNESE